MELLREGDSAYLTKGNKTEVFKLWSKKDCERLQAITKFGFDMIMDRPGEALNLSTLEFSTDVLPKSHA